MRIMGQASPAFRAHAAFSNPRQVAPLVLITVALVGCMQ